MEQPNWEEVSRTLYEALMQMRHSRGIHMDDFDLVLGAMETYESMADIKACTKMWRENYHPSMPTFWVATCMWCEIGEFKLDTVEAARKWCRDHECGGATVDSHG